MSEFVAGQRLDIGRVISQTFGTLGRNLLPIVLIAVVVCVVVYGLSSGARMLLALTGSRTMTTVIASAVGGFIGLTVQSIAVGGITLVAARDLDGQRTPLSMAFGTGVRLMFPLLGLGLVMGIGIGLGCVVFFVPGIMLAVRWTVATPVRVMEGPTMSRALQRSAELTDGSRWRLLGLAAIYVLLIVLVQLLFSLGGGGIFGHGGPVAAPLLQLASTVVSTCIGSTGYAVCYFNLRQIREGATPNELAAVFA